MGKINTVQISGISYSIEDSEATKVVNVTQAEYDALVQAGTVDPTALYNITDATAVDISQYWNSAETQSAITQATSGKADTTAVTESISQAVSGKQDTLSAGTNITIVDNVISAEGGGSVTIDPSLDTGSTNAVANSAITTAINAVSGAVPTQYVKKIVQNSDNGVVRHYEVWKESGYAFPIYNFSINGKMVLSKQNGTYPDAYNFNLVETSAFTAHTADTTIHVTAAQTASWDGAVSDISTISGNVSTISGDVASLSGDVATVSGAIPTTYVNSIQADTDAGYQRFYRFSTPSNFNYFILRNAKINGRQVLNAGWSSSVNEYSLVETSAITTAITSSSTDAQVPSAKAVNDKLGGLSIVKMSQSEYDALATKDSNTLYVING